MALELCGVSSWADTLRGVASSLIAAKASRDMKESNADCSFLIMILVSSCLQRELVCLRGILELVVGG